MGRIGLFALLLCSAAPAFAGEKPLYAPAPSWAKAGPSIDPAKIAGTDQLFVAFDIQQRIERGQITVVTYVALHAANAEAMQAIGTVTMPWQPEKGDLTINEFAILRGKDRIDLLANGAQPFTVLRREQQLESAQITGVLTATAPVAGLSIDDIVVLKTTMTSADPALKGGAGTIAPLPAQPFPVSNGRYRLSWPVAEPLHWTLSSSSVKPTAATENGYSVVEVALPLPKPDEKPDDAPLRFRAPATLEASTFADWASISRLMAPLYAPAGLMAADSPIATEVARIKAASTDPRQRAALALQLVQDKIRYLASGLNGGNLVPQAPAVTWQSRAGDCKAKTLLLLAILHELGITAEPTLASVQASDLVKTRLPNVAAFDHVIVRATIDGKSLWLDGTSTGARLADLDDTPPFRSVLPLRAEGADLLTIDAHAPARPDVAVDLTIDNRAALKLPSLYRIDLSYRGQLVPMLRAGFQGAAKEKREELVQSVVAQYLSDPTVATYELSFDDAAGTAHLVASGVVTTLWDYRDQRYRIGIGRAVDAIGFNPDRARPAWQTIPVATPDPGYRRYVTHVLLPGPGFTVDGDQALPTMLAGQQLSRTVTIGPDAITATETARTDGREIAAKDAPAARAALALAQQRTIEVLAPANYPPRWKQISGPDRVARLKPLRDVYAALIAKDPKDISALVNRGNFLMGIYDFKGAIADYGAAIAIEPTAELYNARASAYDVLGQRAAAIADVRKAIELDPSSGGYESYLGSLLAQGGDVAGGLALLDARIAAGGKDKNDYIVGRADILAKAGRVPEALSALDAAVTASPGNVSLLNERCWVKGTTATALDTALKDCTKAIELADNPASMLDSRAMVYFRLDRLDDALADLDAALERTPDQDGSLFLRAVIRKRRGDLTGATDDITGARLINPQVDRQYAVYKIAY